LQSLKQSDRNLEDTPLHTVAKHVRDLCQFLWENLLGELNNCVVFVFFASTTSSSAILGSCSGSIASRPSCILPRFLRSRRHGSQADGRFTSLVDDLVWYSRSILRLSGTSYLACQVRNQHRRRRWRLHCEE
jgi:hypothetical protein